MTKKKLVTYQEAFECFRNGGTIMVEYNNWQRIYNNNSGKQSDTISWHSIFYGQWYILSK